MYAWKITRKRERERERKTDGEADDDDDGQTVGDDIDPEHNVYSSDNIIYTEPELLANNNSAV